ncbi:hypothetical protein PsorP6_016886 [Peronosclerospora sorghi]|uniref:Uncharacterized protein n=1 Tax=Peronosclerospora sorghi TaxID=230839 RepID=A0ACC0WCX0_9STRA|nr:hypothetical protein PsorP6_016886 [Peronosclerospora sorghi]
MSKKKGATRNKMKRMRSDGVRATALRFETCRTRLGVKPLYQDMIFAVPTFLSLSECQRVTSFATAQGFERVTQRASREFAFRDNDRLCLRMPGFAELLWQRLAPHVPATCDTMHAMGLNPSMRFYRYQTGQRFGCHVDQSDVDPVTGYHSRFTVLVYLNDARDSDLQGGETLFYATERDVVLEVTPETGLALVHGHGERCLLHEGAQVRQGTKYLLRTDIMYARALQDK